MGEISTIRFDFLNVWKGNFLFFLAIRIFRFIDRWIDMIFEELILLSVIELILELIMIHKFLIERMLTNYVTVGETVAYRVWN
jgi:hypothetical protein